jgi:hypothetical protein
MPSRPAPIKKRLDGSGTPDGAKVTLTSMMEEALTVCPAP